MKDEHDENSQDSDFERLQEVARGGGSKARGSRAVLAEAGATCLRYMATTKTMIGNTDTPSDNGRCLPRQRVTDKQGCGAAAAIGQSPPSPPSPGPGPTPPVPAHA